jgi:7 transmembrane receptor (rhodopsin family)
MRTVTNIFIVNLAVADFFVILLCLPPTVVWDVTETWFLGEVPCKVVIYFQVSLHSSRLLFPVFDQVAITPPLRALLERAHKNQKTFVYIAKITTSCSISLAK